MNASIRKCKVCGKEYRACDNTTVSDGVFRWRDVACSPECGAIYLQRVMESRGETTAQQEVREERKPKKERSKTAGVTSNSAHEDATEFAATEPTVISEDAVVDTCCGLVDINAE